MRVRLQDSGRVGRCLSACTTGILILSFCSRARAEEEKLEKARVTVADTIEMTRWADRDYFLGAPGRSAAKFSPDGSQFVVVVSQGNVVRNTCDDSILLFHTSEAFQSPRPIRLITMSSSSNREAIKNVKWLSDGRTITFLGENPGETPQVYGLHVETKQLELMTHHPTPVVAYDISDDGEEIAYEANPPEREFLRTREARRDGVLVTRNFLNEFFSENPDGEIRPYAIGAELFRQRRGQPAMRVEMGDSLSDYEPLSISPTGRYALVAAFVSEIPATWSEYEDRRLHPYILSWLKTGGRSHLTRYSVLDMETGEIAPLINAPMSWSNGGFAWARDGSSIVVSGVYLPLEGVDGAEREGRRNHPFVVEVCLPERKIVEVSQEDARVVRWSRRTSALLLEGKEAQNHTASMRYRKAGSSWVKLPNDSQDAEDAQPITVTLEEGMNEPPKLFVSTAGEPDKKLLFDLNPQFVRLWFGTEEEVTWKATDGHEVTGGMYLPPDYVPGRRYPLVIQTHGFDRNRFWIDGPWSSAFAAQPLAARGMVVLQVGSSATDGEDGKRQNTPEEGPWHMAAYEGAIDYLDRRGLIDRGRVGIIGFSRTVFQVAYALTHSKYSFLAATLADGFDAGYLNFLLYGGADYEAVNGGPPVGETHDSWLKNSPGFNLDRVNSAVRIEHYGPGGFLGGWEWYSGLSALRKPTEFIWLPYGTHLLVKPGERLVSQEGNVDWFAFWLQGVEDAKPEKEAQYRRWRELRRLESWP